MTVSKKPSKAERVETLLADKNAIEDAKRLIEKEKRELFVKETNAFLTKIQSPFTYTPKELSEETVDEISLKKMSRYARAFKNFKGVAGTAMKVGGAVIQVGESLDDIHHTPQNVELAHDFHMGAIALTVINFFRIPVMYLFGRLMGQPVPFALSDKLRLGYSTLLLALTITALAAPVTAPVIAFISASIGLALSTFFMGKLIYERYQLAKQEKSLNQDIKIAEGKLDEMRREAAELEQAFGHNDRDSAVLARIDELRQSYDEHLLHMQGLYDKRAQNEQLIAKFTKANVFLRTTSFLLAALAIVGLIVALFLPPIGLGILAGVAITSSALVMGKLGLSAAQWVKNKWSANPNSESEASVNHDDMDLQADMTLDKTPMLDSTIRTLNRFNAAEKTVATQESVVEYHEQVIGDNVSVDGYDKPGVTLLAGAVTTQEPSRLSGLRFFSFAPPSGEGLATQPEAATNPEPDEGKYSKDDCKKI